MRLSSIDRPSSRTRASGRITAIVYALCGLGCSDRGDLQVGVLKSSRVDCSVTHQADYCQAVPIITGPPPVIDGELDCGLQLQEVPSDTASRAGLPAGVSAEYAIGYTSNGLYYFVQVVKDELRPAGAEDALFCGDAVQLFADSDGAHPLAPSYDAPGTAQFVIPAPDNGVQSATKADVYVYAPAHDGANAWSSSKLISVRTSQGYAVEALITGMDLGVPNLVLEPGQRVGLDVWICVGGERLATNDCGNRVNDYGLHVVDSEQGLLRGPHFNSAAFCDPMLAE